MRRIIVLTLATLGAVVALAAGLLFWAAAASSDRFVLEPVPARALAPVVSVNGKQGAAGPGGLYFTAVGERPASLLESWGYGLAAGSKIVPKTEILPCGESWTQSIADGKQEMDFSQQTAVAVALKAAGRSVPVDSSVLIDALAAGNPPAKRAGIRPGDVIVAAQGRRVTNIEGLAKALGGLKLGDRVRLLLRRGSHERAVTTGTYADPCVPNHPMMGIRLAPPRIKLPKGVAVHFDTKDVGGPSAGLGFALQVYSELTGTPIVNGPRVAVTGTLDLNGAVGEIGGVTQKAYGAQEVGARTFLVPAGNLKEAQQGAPKGLRIIPVTSFAQALRVLRGLSSSGA